MRGATRASSSRIKDAIIEAALDNYGHETVEQLLAGGTREPVPIDTSERARRFRTIAHLALDDHPEDFKHDYPGMRRFLEDFKHDYPGMRRFLELRAKRTGRPVGDPALQAEVAVISILQFGWGVFENYVARALEPYDPDLDALRACVAEISERIDTPIDPDPRS